MYAHVVSLGVTGLDGYPVTVETHISGGLPKFAMVGLPDSAVKESSERVRSAIKNLNCPWPASHVTVNLAPADVRKTGSLYDLPVFIGILAAQQYIPQPEPHQAFLGELGLDGTLRPIAGALPMALAAQKAGVTELFVPAENAAEAAVAEQLTVYPARSAADVIRHLAGQAKLSPASRTGYDAAGQWLGPDFADVRGQAEARRALEVAAAGGHNLLMVGPPGTGKSMLAKRLPGILPPLSYEEALETTAIYSVAGLVQAGTGLLQQRPFRSPHHSVSAAAIAGGGTVPRPGEVSLAHNGVLFLDELPEFSREALEVLRQPIEDGCISVSRVHGTATYPCRFMLVAAMNPCKCGYYGSGVRECSCTPSAIERYRQRISGPLLDRIDLHVEARPVEYDALAAKTGGEPSTNIRARVAAVRAMQAQRYQGLGFTCNAQLPSGMLRRYCPLAPAAEKDHATRKKIIDLAMRLDASTVPFSGRLPGNVCMILFNRCFYRVIRVQVPKGYLPHKAQPPFHCQRTCRQPVPSAEGHLPRHRCCGTFWLVSFCIFPRLCHSRSRYQLASCPQFYVAFLHGTHR